MKFLRDCVTLVRYYLTVSWSGDLLEQVEAELARRQQQGADSLGPADLDSLLAASQVAAVTAGENI